MGGIPLRPTAAPHEGARETEALVLALLTAAAEAGRACPGNAELAKAIGAKSIATPARFVGLLEQRGVIAVERGNRSRVVTILATGARTAAADAAGGPVRGSARKAQLAELVAEGASLSAAARTMGLTQQRVSQIWAGIRADLGAQAV